VVFWIEADRATNHFLSAKLVYSLSASTKPGKYTMCAPFPYRTEKASPLDRAEMQGRLLPLGGFDSPPGRI
jgi:hypothetical protein